LDSLVQRSMYILVVINFSAAELPLTIIDTFPYQSDDLPL